MFEIFKKVKLNHKMKQFVDEISTINWFSNVDNVFTSNLNYYNTISVKRVEALKILRFTYNTNKIVRIHNLVNEADRRAISYLYNNRRKDHQWTWSKLSKKIGKLLILEKSITLQMNS